MTPYAGNSLIQFSFSASVRKAAQSACSAPFCSFVISLVLACTLALPAAATAARKAPSSPQAQARTQGPFSQPFTHYADQQDIAAVLSAFARSQGLGVGISQKVTGKISGRFDSVPPLTFLSAMRSAFGVSWYRLGPAIHFYSESEYDRTFFSPRALSASALYQMLLSSSVCSPQLPPSIDSGGSMVTVSGPPEYLKQVAAAVASFEESQATQMAMRVFPLKYAWAEDITVNSQDKTVVVPGVASILRAMVTGGGAAGGTTARTTQDKATVGKLGGTGLIALGKEEGAGAGGNGQGQTQTPPAQAVSNVNIMADQRVNSVLVSDAAYRMPYYEKVIADLDKPVELVEIHAAIVDIDSNQTRSLGFTYQGGQRTGSGWGYGGELAPGPGTFPPIPTPGTTTGQGLSFSTIYTHGTDYFLARVQALEVQGSARMLGKPSVLTVDNVQATLENTTTYYIRVQGYQAVDLFKIDAGTVLRVTPHIIRDALGRVTIKLVVNVQDGQNSNTSIVTTVDGTPVIKQTKINTQAIVGAEQSLLIGGYSYEQKGVDANGIPILMDIPVLGHLFKTNTRSAKRVERLILITPKVVDLNNLPAMPARLDDPSFSQSPTQSDYTARTPAGQGCSKTVFTPIPDPVLTVPDTAAKKGTADTTPTQGEQGVPIGKAATAPAASPAATGGKP